jgi:WD40 repeat protein
MQRIDNIFFSPLGTYYVVQGLSAEYEEETWIYLTKTMETVGYVDGHVFAFSRDEKAVFGAERASVAIWVMPALQLRGHLHGHTSDILDMDVSRDNQYLATSSYDKTARIWSRQGGEIVHVLRGHEHYVTIVRFSTDGTFVVTASNDNTIRTWSMQTGKELHLFTHNTRTLEISPCSRIIIAQDCFF